MAKNYKYIVIAIVIALAAWYVFGGNGPSGQTGFDAIKNGISNTLSKQRAISNQAGELGADIDGSINTVGNIEKSNTAANDAIEKLEREITSTRAIIEDNRKRLAECQSIVDRMEKGAGQGDSQTEARK